MEPTKTRFEQGSGGCYLIENAINETTYGEYFSRLKDEVNWQHMLNRGNPVPRLVAVQPAQTVKPHILPVWQIHG